jgi:glycosyltransferase involved in cell wall biosynthesis
MVSGDLATLTGGYLYDARIVEGLRQQGWDVQVHNLATSFPNPDEHALAQATAQFNAIPEGARVVIDGLALGGMPQLVMAHAQRLRLFALVHHPLALETGLTRNEQKRLFDNERDALAAVARIIVTSPNTARALADYGVPEECIGVVLPGTDPAPLAVGSASKAPVLLCVATITPRKGHADLVDALGNLRDRPWQLLCVGSLTRSLTTVVAVRARIAAYKLDSCIALLGEAEGETLNNYYHHADLFVLPSYYEGYGMALAEALARGLPIVSTTAGAIPDTVPADAALLVPPGDKTQLTEVLRRVLDDAELRQQLAMAARQARQQLPSWGIASQHFADQLRQVH